jgi:hypothetical protein
MRDVVTATSLLLSPIIDSTRPLDAVVPTLATTSPSATRYFMQENNDVQFVEEEEDMSMEEIQNTLQSNVAGIDKGSVKGKGKANAPLELSPSIVTRKANSLPELSQSVVPRSLLQRMAGPSDQKAGLGIRDKEEVKRVIYEASKGSDFFKDQERKDADLTMKVDSVIQRLQILIDQRDGVLEEEEILVDQMIARLELERNLKETIVVVDADAFYARLVVELLLRCGNLTASHIHDQL